MHRYQLNPIRARLGLRWTGTQPDYISALKNAGHLISGLFIVLAAYGWAGASDAEAQAEIAQRNAERKAELSSARLAHCLNGGAFRVGDGAIKCQQPIYEGVK